VVEKVTAAVPAERFVPLCSGRAAVITWSLPGPQQNVNSRVSANEVRIGALREKSLKTLPENRERRCWGEMCRETVPEIVGGDWKGPSAHSSEVVR